MTSELNSGKLYVAAFAEMLGTALLVIIGCGSAITWNATSPPGNLHISLTFGFSVGVIVWSIAHISGGHINPAVSFGLLCARRISVVRFMLYVVAQGVHIGQYNTCKVIGAILGALILNSMTPETESIVGAKWLIGTPSPNEFIGVGTAFGVELIITFVLVFCVFATCDPKREDSKYSGPIVIGLSIAMCHLYAVPVTGSGMNPARVIGPAIISGKWVSHWLYWVGPLIGGGLAGIMYELIFALNASKTKLNAFFAAGYNCEDFDEQDVVELANVVEIQTRAPSNKVAQNPNN